VLATVYLLAIAPVLDLYAQRKAMIADEEMLLPRFSVAAGLSDDGFRLRLSGLGIK